MAGYVPEWWVDVRNGPLELPVKVSGAKARKPSVSYLCSAFYVLSGTHLSHIYPCCMNSLYHTCWHLATHCTLKALQLSSNSPNLVPQSSQAVGTVASKINAVDKDDPQDPEAVGLIVTLQQCYSCPVHSGPAICFVLNEQTGGKTGFHIELLAASLHGWAAEIVCVSIERGLICFSS